ncbi:MULTISPECIES: hypothetical protein [Methylomonas]|uniref:Uncharacterized protein n=1 Tax=Methylomonas albis TaxID=1854563 RepID=A0ABR9D355_9GAMM|nr:hypothetical protein [Methylomonas albis]MBD9357495.1 hypothetical protein [Methylomonas albis]
MEKIKALGWKHSKGTLEDSTPYDFVTVYAIARMESKDNQRGLAGVDFRALPEIKEQLQKIQFGQGVVELQVEFEKIATGKGMFKDYIVNVQPPVAKAG